METAPRIETSSSGSSSRATSDAEYTDAPASLTTTTCGRGPSAGSSRTTSRAAASVSREAARERLRLVEVERVRLEHRARAGHRRDLHTGAKAGVEPDDDALAGGRREQQLLEVRPEDRDGLLIGAVLQLDAELHLDAR